MDYGMFCTTMTYVNALLTNETNNFDHNIIKIVDKNV